MGDQSPDHDARGNAGWHIAGRSRPARRREMREEVTMEHSPRDFPPRGERDRDRDRERDRDRDRERDRDRGGGGGRFHPDDVRERDRFSRPDDLRGGGGGQQQEVGPRERERDVPPRDRDRERHDRDSYGRDRDRDRDRVERERERDGLPRDHRDREREREPPMDRRNGPVMRGGQRINRRPSPSPGPHPAPNEEEEDGWRPPVKDLGDKSSHHKLHRAWCLWFTKTGNKNPANWRDALHEYYTFDTVEQFWFVYNRIRKADRMAHRSDYHLFREGVVPSWEDAENREGGRLIVKVPKDITAAIWEDMVLALIGEQFQTEDPDEICGAVISVRRGEDSLSLWHKSKTPEVRDQLIEALKRVLRLGDSFAIDWREHSKSLGLASVKDNRSRPTPTPPKHGDNEPPIPPGGIELPPRETLDDDRRARDMMRDNNIGGQRPYGGGGGRFPRGERVGGGWREGEGEGRRPPPDRKQPPFNRPNRLASFDTHNEAEPTPPSSAKHALGAPPPPRPVGLGGGWGRGKVLRPGGIGRGGAREADKGDHRDEE